MTTINPADVCCCGHFKDEHSHAYKYSRAMEQAIYTEICAGKRCKCHHFQSTILVPNSNQFEVVEAKKKEKELEQAEMFV